MIYSHFSLKRKLGFAPLIVLVSLACSNHGFAMEEEGCIQPLKPYSAFNKPEEFNDYLLSEEDPACGFCLFDLTRDEGRSCTDPIMSPTPLPASSQEESVREERLQTIEFKMFLGSIRSIEFDPRDDSVLVNVHFTTGAINQLAVDYNQITELIPEEKRRLINATFSLYQDHHPQGRGAEKFRRKVLYYFLYNGDHLDQSVENTMNLLKGTLEEHKEGRTSKDFTIKSIKSRIHVLVGNAKKSDPKDSPILQYILQNKFPLGETKRTSADVSSPVLSQSLYSERPLQSYLWENFLQEGPLNRKKAVDYLTHDASTDILTHQSNKTVKTYPTPGIPPLGHLILLPSFKELLHDVHLKKRTHASAFPIGSANHVHIDHIHRSLDLNVLMEPKFPYTFF